eukprot:9081184-Pyramimonas_sp.AAC.1
MGEGWRSEGERRNEVSKRSAMGRAGIRRPRTCSGKVGRTERAWGATCAGVEKGARARAGKIGQSTSSESAATRKARASRGRE